MKNELLLVSWLIAEENKKNELKRERERSFFHKFCIPAIELASV